jgi:hypothetical protein
LNIQITSLDIFFIFDGGKMVDKEYRGGFTPSPKGVESHTAEILECIMLDEGAVGGTTQYQETDFSPGLGSSTTHGILVTERVDDMINQKKTDELWTGLRQNPERYIDTEKFAESAFIAGGGLTLLFGEDNVLWHKIEKFYETNEVAIIAGVPFTKTELELLGDFARFIGAKALLCMDERLETSGCSNQEEIPYVHNSCGAINATAATFAAFGVNVEEINELLRVKRKEEQGGAEQGPDLPVYADMHHHEVTKILVYLVGGKSISEQKKVELKQNQGLPFQVSLSIEKIQQFADKYDVDRKTLIKALVKFGAGIALEIAKGPHNALHEIAAEATSIEVDDRPSADGVQLNPEVVDEIMAELEQVTQNVHRFSQERVAA